MNITKYVLDILDIQNTYDCYGESLYWRTDAEYAPITFFIICNDIFNWASADCEKIDPEDPPALRQAIEDIVATNDYSLKTDQFIMGSILWCARKRKMRPQHWIYPKYTEVRTLFDACGPERPPVGML